MLVARHGSYRTAALSAPRALAVGVLATGALAIGALAIGRLAIGNTRIRRLYIDELTVRRLNVVERSEESTSPPPAKRIPRGQDTK
jgi:hypothetical protein